MNLRDLKLRTRALFAPRVERELDDELSSPERFTRAQFDALRRETSVFTDVYAAVADVDTRLDGRMVSGTFVTGNFFHPDRRRRKTNRPLPTTAVGSLHLTSY